VQLHVVAADRKAAAEAFKLRRCDVAVFDDLKVDLSVVPAGGRRVILPGRCLAILVHTLNRCRGMTLERLSDVYKGRATDWGEFDGLGDRAGSDTAIRPCGVRSPAGLGLVFHEKVARIAGTRHFQMMEDSSRAMARLSMTPGGIAFVDAAACTDELGKRGLRLLPVGIGENAVLPSPEAVVSGRYPLSTRIALVESPQCSPEARDFLDFVASGGRMRNRFSDTPARVEAAFRAAGGLPPAEPAGEAAAGVQRQGRTTAEEYDR
jgi:hypothetical protein